MRLPMRKVAPTVPQPSALLGNSSRTDLVWVSHHILQGGWPPDYVEHEYAC